MKYAGYMPNDFVNGENVSVSFWVSGCPHRCPGCHNQEMWDFNYGVEVPTDIRGQLIKAIGANGITRNFSVLGGEPLCPENAKLVEEVVTAVHTAYPAIKIYVWTGYTFSELTLLRKQNSSINTILNLTDVLIDGRYREDERDVSLKLRGSRNQMIINLHEPVEQELKGEN